MAPKSEISGGERKPPVLAQHLLDRSGEELDLTIADFQANAEAPKADLRDLEPGCQDHGPVVIPHARDGGSTTPRLMIKDQPTYKVLNFDVAAIDPNAARDRILEYARQGQPRQVHLCNAYTLTLACRDEELASALDSADLNLPDGVPVAWIGRKAGTNGPVRGPGLVIDVFLASVGQDGDRSLRHYLYGGAAGVADIMAENLRSRDSRIDIVGAETPPFRPLTSSELAELANRINESQANLVWIGLGTPRQDYLVTALGPLVTATLVPVGAAFDFISGRIPEAPKFLHGSGFEWLYRLLREPRRLWRRYIVDGARFGMYLILCRRSAGKTKQMPVS